MDDSPRQESLPPAPGPADAGSPNDLASILLATYFVALIVVVVALLLVPAVL